MSKEKDFVSVADALDEAVRMAEEVDKAEKKEQKEVPQHVKDEEKGDAALERMRDQRQMDMYDDEMWNWSGLR